MAPLIRKKEAAFFLLAIVILSATRIQADVAVSVGTNCQSFTMTNATPLPWKIGGIRFFDQSTFWTSASDGEGTGWTMLHVTVGGRIQQDLYFKSTAMGTAAPSGSKLLPATPATFNRSWNTETDVAYPDMYVLLRTGAPGIPDDPTDANPLTIAQLDSVRAVADFYSPTYKYSYTDSLGVNGGRYSGGFIDTWFNRAAGKAETQIQIPIPATSFTVNGTSVNFLPTGLNQYWMSLAIGQEYFHADLQWMAAMGAKETGIGTSFPVQPTNQAGVYGFWQIENWSGLDRSLSYPGFFPKYSAQLARALDAASSGINPDAFMSYYTRGNRGLTPVNSALLLNSCVMSILFQYVNYYVCASATDICWMNSLATAVDPYMGVSYMAVMYNVGAWSQIANVVGLLNPNVYQATCANPNARTLMGTGNLNYVPDILSVVQAEVNASRQYEKNNVNLTLVDFQITEGNLMDMFFGDGGTVATQGNGGLLLHYYDPAAGNFTAMRQQIWNTLDTAFNRLKGRAPTASATTISHRYDFLSVLRTVKDKFPFLKQKQPNSGDASTLIPQYSGHYGACAGTGASDETYPYLGTSATMNAAGDMTVIDTVTDETLAKSVKWTLDYNWLIWNNAAPLDTTTSRTKRTFTFTALKADIDYYRTQPDGQSGRNVWIMASDGSGNSIFKKLAVVSQPPAATLRAVPGDTTYGTATLTVTLTTNTGNVIWWTTDTTLNPAADTANAAVHKINSNTGTVVITGNATLKAFAEGVGYTPVSGRWHYTQNLPQATIAARPGDTTYATATLTVTLTTNTGNVIWWTTSPTLNPATDTANAAVHKINSNTGTVVITGNVTLKAYAEGAGYVAASGQWHYTQNLPAATLSARPGDTTYATTTLTVTLTTNTGNVIWWTTDTTLNPAADTANPAVHKINSNTGAVVITGIVTLKAFAEGAGYVAASGQWHYMQNLPAATLTARPGDTTYATAALTVTLTTNTGNVIWWTISPTLNPSADTANPAVHKINSNTGTVVITGTVTLKAYAEGVGYVPASGQWHYTQALPQATLTANPSDTTYRTSSLSVVLASNSGNVIYCTTNPSVNLSTDTTNPAVQRIVSTGTVVITGTATLRARAYGSGYLPKDSSWIYTCKIPQLIKLELSPDSATISAGDSVVFVARVIDDTGGIRPEYNSMIIWSALSPSGTRSSQRAQTNATNTFYGIDAYKTYTIKASFTDPANQTRIFSDSARVYVTPGKAFQIVIESDTAANRNAADPDTVASMNQATNRDTVYAIVRDAFGNYCRLAKNAQWSSVDPAIASAGAVAGQQYAGIISRVTNGTTFVVAAEAGLLPDSIRVEIAASVLIALRLVNVATGDTIKSIVMKDDQQMTLNVIGTMSNAPGVWVPVNAAWAINPATIQLAAALPAGPSITWTLSPTSAGQTSLIVSSGTQSVTVPVKVTASIRIIRAIACDNPFTPGVSSIPAVKRNANDPLFGTRIEVTLSAPPVDNAGNVLCAGTITIWDAVGNCIADRKEMRSDGSMLYTVWDGKNRRGVRVSAGNYLGKIEIVNKTDDTSAKIKTLIGVR